MEALRASEEQFRRAIENAPMPVIMHAEDGQVLQISHMWTELTGYTLQELPTLDAWLNHAYGDGADAVRNHVHVLFAGDRRTLDVAFATSTRGCSSTAWALFGPEQSPLMICSPSIYTPSVQVIPTSQCGEDREHAAE
jgi:PAS domain-containing protein